MVSMDVFLVVSSMTRINSFCPAVADLSVPL